MPPCATSSGQSGGRLEASSLPDHLVDLLEPDVIEPVQDLGVDPPKDFDAVACPLGYLTLRYSGVQATEKRHSSRKIARILREKIADGVTFPIGARLPSYRQLATEYGVAGNTAQAALKLLQDEGLIEVRPASGSYVRSAEPIGERDLRTELGNLREQLQQTRRDLKLAEEQVADLISGLPTDEQS